jgi:polyferredoxin
MSYAPYLPPPQQSRRTQRLRSLFQVGFFALFLLAPALDIFRFDMPSRHFIVLGLPWTLGIDDFMAGRIGATEVGLNILLRGALPIIALGVAFIWVAWRWGRLYCGWLCPHFSIVESLNQLMRRAIGKHSLWDRHRTPEQNPDGTVAKRDALWWLVLLPVALLFAFLWTISILTYLWPPAQVWPGLFAGTLPGFQVIFLAVGTLAFSLEFLLARHLFCRFACAAGFFQSVAWMGNRKAMVVGYDRTRAPECAGCNAACDNACPMRLQPRNVKRMMFSCVQCGQCMDACAHVKADAPGGALLRWVHEDAAGREASFNTRTAKQAPRIPLSPEPGDQAAP